MRNRRCSSQLALGCGLLGLALAADARADVRWVQTTELVPTASVVEIPRTYLIPSSTVLPVSTTANVYVDAPMTYVPSGYGTSIYSDTITSRPAYRVFRPRRYYERSYVTTPRSLVPTYYVNQEAYPASVSYVATSESVFCVPVCCSDGSAPARTVAPSAVKVPSREMRTSAEFDDRQPTTIDSSVAGGAPAYRRFDTGAPARDEGVNSTGGNVDNSATVPRTALPGSTTTRDPGRSSVVPDLSTTTAPPVPTEANKMVATPDPRPVDSNRSAPKPIDTIKPVTPKATGPNPANAIPFPEPEPEATPPALPLPPINESDLAKPKGDIQRRDAYKPVVTPLDARPRLGRNILQGKVVSADTRRDEEGVEVVVTDKTGQYIDRTTRTDAFGKFAITLPEGDWTIKLTMPSGRRLTVGRGEIKVAAGRIVDMYGRDLTNLVIQR